MIFFFLKENVGSKNWWYFFIFRIGPKAHAKAHNHIWRRQGWSRQPKKPCRGQLYPWLAQAEVEEEWFTDKCNLSKPPKERDKYSR